MPRFGAAFAPLFFFEDVIFSVFPSKRSRAESESRCRGPPAGTKKHRRGMPCGTKGLSPSSSSSFPSPSPFPFFFSSLFHPPKTPPQSSEEIEAEVERVKKRRR